MLNTNLINQRLVSAGPILGYVAFLGSSSLNIEQSLRVRYGEMLGGAMLNSNLMNERLINDRHYLFGESSLFVAGRYQATGIVSLQGTGDVVFNGGKLQKAKISLKGNGILSAQPIRRRLGSLNCEGYSNIIIIPSRLLKSSVNFTGHSSFSGKGVASAFFISSDGVFRPLGLFVLGDSRKSLLPSVREYSERVPGKHGELLFDTKLDPRILELHVATEDGLSPAERERLKRKLSSYLNPTAGDKTLIFAEDLNKIYNVRYSGNIPLTQSADWLEFVIPFKLKSPYIQEVFEQLLAGSGILVNSGNVETFLTIEIAGPATNPSAVVGGHKLSYTGTIAVGKTLTINTETKTAKIDGMNALEGYNGVFPKLSPGSTIVTANNNITFKWKGRWI